MAIYNQEKANQVQAKNDISDITLRVWKNRGKIPDKYFETEERITLLQVLKDSEISNPTFVRNVEGAKEKYDTELKRLLESRKFKPNQNNAYYAKCLISLCRECETYERTGKLSKKSEKNIIF